MKHVLFPTDFSPASENGFDWALMFARRTDATLDLLHAYHFHVAENPTPEKIESFQEKFRVMINDAQRKPGFGEFPTVKTWLIADFAADAIVNLSGKLPADLVVMGTKGTSDLEEILIGGIAAKIATDSTVPVLVIPPKAQFRVPDCFIIATNLETSQLKGFIKIAVIAKIFNATLEVVHIQVPSEHFDQKKLDHFEEGMKKLNLGESLRFHLFKAKSVEDGLSEFCDSREGGILCMAHKKRNFLSSLFERSHSKKMVLHTHLPLIVFPSESTN